jgi:type VI secretion system protein ImpJ
MNSLTQLVDAIQWHEGMLLTPHHFQQLALRNEQLLHYALASFIPFHWGILKLEIDPVPLVEGQFTLLELEAVLPDGLMIAHNAKITDLSINLTKYLGLLKTQATLAIYLSVPRHLPAAVASEPRYQSVDGEPVLGINDGEGEMTIPRLRPRLQLTVGEPPSLNRFTSLPLAQVTYQNEVFALTSFIPPVLQIHTHSLLGQLCHALIQTAHSKAKFLSEQLRSSSAIQLDKSQLFNTQNILQGLGTALPQLEAMLATQVSHPYPLYLSLCSLAGSLATFTSAMVPPVFNAYNHNDLLATFTPVSQFIETILDRIRESYIVIPLDRQNQHNTCKITTELQWLPQKNYFVLRLEERQILTHNQLNYIVIGFKGWEGQPKLEQLISWGESCQIGSHSYINSIRERRIYGAQRQRLVTKEPLLQLVPPTEVALFQIEIHPEFIAAEEVLILVNELDNLPQPAEAMLYTVPYQ